MALAAESDPRNAKDIRDSVALLKNNAGKASKDAYLALTLPNVRAMDYKFGSVARDFGRYPARMMGNSQCHL